MKTHLLRKTGLSALLASIIIAAGCPAPDPGYVPAKIYMFSAGLHTGDLGGRTGADVLASAAVSGAGLAGTTRYAHAFISVSASDCIANMPSTYGFPSNIPVYAPNGTTLIASNWSDLLDSSIPLSLESALPGINSGVMPYWWTGSSADETCTIAYNNCQAWTVANHTPEDMGMVASVTETNNQWISGGGYEGDVALYLICIAY